MQLKKLIVTGFKSFADRVTLNFDDGITGVVGPNGSGKSNVIDAVRWVMGEQNAKHLRGQVATDIIFAGSDKRKELGMAEVTLVFDNKDASPFSPPEYRHEPEISLSRRLYRDGQREYFINKKPCRLKDIVGFFANSGLGGRSYSMIQQGQVDRILNAKPEDVREILEEAAGTMVFKNRRAAAAKKLENTQENLSRIDDIVDELKRQLDALKGQVAKAEKWQGLSDELKTIEMALFRQNFLSFTGRLQELVTGQEKDQDQLILVQKNLVQLEVKVQNLQKDLAESDPELDQIREDISTLREQIVRAEGAISSAMATIEAGDQRLLDLQQSLDNDNEGLDLIKESVEKNMNAYDEANRDLENCRNALEGLRDELDQVDESAQVFGNRKEDLDDQLRNLERILESNEMRCEAIKKERTRIADDMQARSSRFDGLKTGILETEEELSKAQELADERQVVFDEALSRKQELESQLQSLDHELAHLRNQREDLREKWITAKSQRNALEALEAEATSLGDVVRLIEEQRPDLNYAVVGILSEMIRYTDDGSDRLPAAVKKNFELWSERLIVRDFDAMKSVASFLREQKIGSIAVSILEGPVLGSSAPGLKPLRQYVSSEQGYEDLGIYKILDRLYFAEEGSNFHDVEGTQVVFTESGLTCKNSFDFEVRGTIGAGGRLSRKEDIDRLLKEEAENQNLIESIDQNLEELNEKKINLKEWFEEAVEAVDSQNKETMEGLAKLQGLKQTLEHQQSLFGDAELTLEDYRKRDRELITELAELGEARIAIGQEKADLAVEAEGLSDESESILERKDEMSRMVQAREIEFGRLEAKVAGLKDTLAQATAQLERSEGGFEKRQNERLKIEEDIKKAEDQKALSHQEMEAYLGRRDVLEEELTVRREKSSDILEALKAVETELKEERKREASLNTDLVKNNAEIEKLRTASKDILAQAEEKYQIDLMNESIAYDPDFDAAENQKRASSLKGQISGLGAINMVAIEEYKRLSERYEFITLQREEVLSSILLLEEAICEIEETSKEKFESIFAVVNQNFQELFPILFPGGEAKLELTDQEDMLNAGVEIMVRMPGKMPRNMTLYSGGEKALTAISLIFALLKTKPTPFCFLDEVDAPLDEANVGRYNKVLTALSDRFQFIVITHNRRTMEVLDQLYGVTMQEGGVSTVLGVDMRKDLPKHLQKSFKEEEKREGATAL